jgi:hypothetical protein
VLDEPISMPLGRRSREHSNGDLAAKAGQCCEQQDGLGPFIRKGFDGFFRSPAIFVFVGITPGASVAQKANQFNEGRDGTESNESQTNARFNHCRFNMRHAGPFASGPTDGR